MKPLGTKQTKKSEAFLSVSYKAADTLHTDLFQAQDCVIITNTQFYITGFNKAAELLFGLSKKHFATVTLPDAINFKFKNTCRRKILSDLFKTGSWGGEIIFTDATGRDFNFYSTVHLINNSNSVVITGKLVASENNEHHAAIAQTTETLFSLFMENSQTGSWIYDENDYIIFANNAYTDSTGFEGDPIGKHISEVFPERLTKKLVERNKQLLASNKPSITEHSLTRPDGTVIHFVSNAFIFKTADNKRYIGGQAIDITDRKNSEVEVQKMHDRFTYAVNATSEAVWDLDLKTNEIYRSDAFYKISGYSKDQVAGNLNWWFNKIHPEDKERVKKHFEQDLMASKKICEDDYRFQYADGTY